MTNMYDSGLFSELGDLLGHDPTFYEESDVSSLSGGITKQSLSTFSLDNVSVKNNPQVPEPFLSPVTTGKHLFYVNYVISGSIIIATAFRLGVDEFSVGFIMCSPLKLVDISIPSTVES